MAHENVDVVRSAYEGFNREGSPGTLPYLHADVEWDESNLPARRPGIYRGHDGILKLGQQNAELWKEIRVDIDDLVDVGAEIVVAFVRVRGRGKNTGEEVELAMSQVWTVRDGKGVRVKLYLDRHQAMEAAGAE
jgi:ketosteroid isomerase-like protein